MMQSLTDRQKQVLEFVARYLDQNGCPPTLREISDELGIRGTATAIVHLDALERKGYVTRRDGSRGIALTRKSGKSVCLPIIGTVRAGMPEPAIEDILGYYNIDASWLKGEGNFILKIKGDSMINAGVYDGDYGIIRPQSTADNGEIVVALIGGEATLKRFFREKDYIRLQPENNSMEPIIIREGDAETVIAGKLLKTIRFFD
jgi:repressor LexA